MVVFLTTEASPEIGFGNLLLCARGSETVLLPLLAGHMKLAVSPYFQMLSVIKKKLNVY